ncbi:hypothetical protein HWV62_12753 [Athelia sp. TMB]|nr:hypothetical protein HWV62_12753 [Athelia sp. TMB]
MSSQSSSSSAPSQSVLPISDEVATWKRKFEELEAQLAVTQELEPARQSAKSLQINSGRAVRRIVDMFASVSDLVAENTRRLESDLSDEDSRNELTIEEERAFRSYNVLAKYVPLIKTLSESSNENVLRALYSNLRTGSDNARGDDAGKLKAAVVTWINDKYGPSTPPLRINSKEERGLFNIHTGRLLRPALYDWDDENVQVLIRDGNSDFAVTAQDWPAFCYPGNKCDPADIEKGLFRGPMLIRAFKYLFTSPSSVTDDDDDPISSTTPQPNPPAKRHKTSEKKSASTRTNVAILMGLKSVTPHAIAYVAVQLRYALSSTSTWKTEDSQFDHMEFYYAIVNYFEETPGPLATKHVEELLAWWNTEVFGRSTGVLQPPGPRAGSSASIMEEQRRAREEAASQQ